MSPLFSSAERFGSQLSSARFTVTLPCLSLRCFRFQPNFEQTVLEGHTNRNVMDLYRQQYLSVIMVHLAIMLSLRLDDHDVTVNIDIQVFSLDARQVCDNHQLRCFVVHVNVRLMYPSDAHPGPQASEGWLLLESPRLDRVIPASAPSGFRSQPPASRPNWLPGAPCRGVAPSHRRGDGTF